MKHGFPKSKEDRLISAEKHNTTLSGLVYWHTQERQECVEMLKDACGLLDKLNGLIDNIYSEEYTSVSENKDQWVVDCQELLNRLKKTDNFK